MEPNRNHTSIDHASQNRRIAVCIDRQYGSGGRAVGKRVSELLGFNFYDNALVNMAVERGELSYSQAQDGDERAINPWMYTPVSSAQFQDAHGFSGPERMYRITGQLIREVAEKSNSVFVGRLADVVLEDAENVDLFSVFVYGPEAYRIQRLIKTEGFSDKKDAVNAMKKKDKQRRNYYNYYTGREYGRPENYDLCIDSSFLGIDKTAQAICTILKMKYDF